jgi:exodeoxyribonuclease V alpha subunit
VTVTVEIDRYDVRVARRASAPLIAFNEAGVLVAADVHVAQRLAELAKEASDAVVLAAAFAVRAPRLGHVFVDLARIHETATVDADEPVDLASLPWPEPSAWIAQVAASTLVGPDRPLRLQGSALYLDRYWREEEQVAADLQALVGPAHVDRACLEAGVERLFTDGDADQKRAAAAAVLRRLAVVAGGPGTGKTTTVARIVALLEEQAAAAADPPPLVALAAPTGKAAARLQEAVHDEAAELDVSEPIRERLLGLEASTLHRLLGWKAGSHSRFRHDRGNRLPYDVVIVDETSMVSLSLMSRLIEAVRPDARLILVGDPGQLTSIEAGAVLGDIVGAAANSSVGKGIVVLRRIHRFGGEIHRLAEAIRSGDSDGVMAALTDGSEDVLWIPADAGDPEMAAKLGPIRDGAVESGKAVIEAARDGDALKALERLTTFRVLCAHRRGRYGVSTWMPRIESWLAGAVADFSTDREWYLGRPLLVTENDHAIRLYNGDTGVVVTSPSSGRPAAAFERQGEVVTFSPSRLAAVETVYAMTIHKSQGSQFGTAAVVLPDATSPILTRELLYTAVTRAQRRLIVAGTEEAVRAAVARPIARASGLGERLWGGGAAAS